MYGCGFWWIKNQSSSLPQMLGKCLNIDEALKGSIVSQTRTLGMVKAGNAHLNYVGGMITYWFDLLFLQDLLVRNQLHLCMLSFFNIKTT